MTDIVLHLAGPLRILAPTGTPVSGLSRRGQAMVAYLACQPGHRAERARLADLLWSDRAEEQARASLRQELSVLRRVLGDALDADRQAVWLDPGAIDVRKGDGAFLEGFDLPSEGFEDWLRTMRQSGTPAAVAPSARPATERPAVAVMPFDEFGASEADMFADGVVEEITGALSRVREFQVIARQSAFALRGEPLGVPDIAARLGADYVLEGSVRRSGNRVRIAVQLVRGADGHMLWSERFDDLLDDLFDLQDRVATRVAGQVSPNLRAAEIARAATTTPSDRSAYELLLTGLPHFWSHREADNKQALKLFDAALAHDPGYAHAWAMKAWCHAQTCCYIWTDTPAAEREAAIAAAERAASAARDHAPTLVAIGAALSLTTPDRARAESFIDRALDIDPNNAWGWLRKGWVNSLNNRPDVALPAFDRAEALSPLDPFRFNLLFGRANCLAEMKRFPEALALVEAGMNMAPGVTWAWRMVASYAGQAGDTAKAHRALAKYLEHYPGITIRKMREAMPPSIFETQPFYIKGLREAGVPEE